MKQFLYLVLLMLFWSPAKAQSLQPIAKISHTKFPCCLSGIEKKDDSTYYLVSDVKNLIFVARFDKHSKSMKLIDSLPTNLPTQSGLEAVRLFDDGKKIMVTLEGDTLEKTCANAKLMNAILERPTLNFKNLPISECYFVMYNNSGIEGMSVTPDGKSVWVVNERPYDRGTLKDKIIFERYELNSTFEKKEEMEYKLDPAPTKVANEDNGISEILVYNKDSTFVMERAYDKAIGTTVKIFWFNTKTRTKHPQPAFDAITIKSIGVDRVDNYEGMCFGPEKDGHKTIFIISDDNAKRHQRTDIIWIKIL